MSCRQPPRKTTATTPSFGFMCAPCGWVSTEAYTRGPRRTTAPDQTGAGRGAKVGYHAPSVPAADQSWVRGVGTREAPEAPWQAWEGQPAGCEEPSTVGEEQPAAFADTDEIAAG